MDRGGSDLSPSLPEPEKPCLIVEDSQPDSGALDDDPDSSYRTLLAQSLSSLQHSPPHSPVLEVISSPTGSRCSQTDSQSEQRGAGGEASCSTGAQEESQVIAVCPTPRSQPHSASRCASENMVMEPGSSTHCSTSEGTSQLGLELSESQVLGGEEDVTDRQHSQSADMKASTGTAAIKEPNTKRSEANKGSHDQASKGSHDQASKASHDQANKGSHDQANKGSHDQASKGSHDQANKGSHDQASKGSHDQAIKGSHDQASRGSHDQANKGSHDQASKGSHDQASRGSHDQANKGSHDQASRGSHDQASRGSHDQASRGTHDQASRGSHDQASKGSHDQASRGSQSQASKGSHDQASRGSHDQASRGSQSQASKGSHDQASRGSHDQASRGSHDQASRGSHDQASRGSHDQASRGSHDQASRGTQDQASRWDQASRGSQSQASRESQSQASRGSQSQASRESQNQASRGSQSQASRGDKASRGTQDQASRGDQDQASRWDKASRGTHDQASRGDQSQASRGDQSQASRGDQSQASRGDQSQASRGDQSQASRGDQSQASRGSLSVQALLHQQDSELLSSQEDLFDHSGTGPVLDNQGVPTATPAQTLRLLHLSGHGTLVEQSLSQSSVDYVAPTQDPLSQTPLIVPNSPTGSQHLHGEPMDTALPPPAVQTGVKEKEEPMEMEGVFKPRPSASTPVSQNSPGFVLERSLSVPSQPEFSHDVFIPTQSQDGPHDPLASASGSRPVPPGQSCSLSLRGPEDSQDTQIEGLAEPLGTGDPMTSPQQTACSQPPPNPALPAATGTEGHTACSQPLPNPALPAATGTEGHTACSQPPPNPALPAGTEGRGSPQNRTVQPKHVQNLMHSRHGASEPKVSCSQPSKSDTPSHSAPCSQTSPSPSGVSPKSRVGGSATRGVASDPAALRKRSDPDLMLDQGEEGEEGEESTMGLESCVLGLELSQEEEEEGSDVLVLEETQRGSQLLDKGAWSQSKRNSPQSVDSKVPVSTNGHGSQSQKAPDRLSQSDRGGPEAEGIKDKSMSDSSGEIPFHFTLPKGSQLIGPAISATPPLVSQLKQTPRHSTPIEISSFSEKSAAVGDVSMATSDITAGDSGEDTMERPDGKLSLRMKLVTPVEEGSSERFSLQKPALSDEEGSVVKVTTVTKALTSPSVFSRVRQAHRQPSPATPARGHLFSSPQSSIGCNSLPNSQSELCSSQGPNQDALASPLPAAGPESGSAPGEREETGGPGSHSATCTPPRKLCQRTVSQQTSFEAPLPPGGRGEPETPPRSSGPAHRRHVRTIQEVRTTVTRVITDVFYEDGKEVERKVTQESEDPVVDVQDSDISPCRTGSSLTPGDLGDVSSMSSKASSSSTGPGRPNFIMPPSRGAKPGSPRRGGGQRGQRAGSHVVKERGGGAMRARGGARRGRPPSHSSPGRGSAVSAQQEVLFSPRPGPQQRLPESPSQTSQTSDSLRSSPEAQGSAASSFVGLRVVAKWSSNGYFYSGRITREEGEGRFRLRFDDGYECEVPGKDVLLCDPIPTDTEVTALLDDQFFSIGRVKGHKMEKQDVFYSVEREGQLQWFKRSAVILSLEQGNQLREQFSLGPYEPASPLTKAADISLDNLVEGKRRRRGGAGDTPNHSSSDSPRTPGPSGKRKLIGSEKERTPAKRGRRGAGPRAGQRAGVVNTSGSGTDLPGADLPGADLPGADLPGADHGPLAAPPADHGPLPQNASLFLGFAFMLTASSEIDRQTNQPISEGEDEYVQTSPYNRLYTEEQLQAGGGFVLPDFNQEQCKAAYQSLLIADQHCRTRKYLLCVASGVPCVSHMWVRDCCRDNKLLNYRNYLLPAGVGPDHSIIEWHPSCSPLASLRVLLVFEPPVELWCQLVSLSGAASVRQHQADKDSADVPVGRFDLVVTDAACPPLVLQSVTSQKVPLVSPEWLIHSIICGERLDYHSNPQYRHDYSSE